MTVEISSRKRKRDCGVSHQRINVVFKTVLETTTDFCEVSSLHGLRPLGLNIASFKKGVRFLSVAATAMWMTAILVCIVLAIFLMSKIWERYSISPTITTIETNNYPISSVLFPGVTICNINVVNKPQADIIRETLKTNGISTDEHISQFFSNLYTLINYEEVDGDYSSMFNFFDALNYTTGSLMKMLAQPCDSLLKKCLWLGKLTNCNDIFRQTTSGFGFCCSFNYKALKSYLEV